MQMTCSVTSYWSFKESMRAHTDTDTPFHMWHGNVIGFIPRTESSSVLSVDGLPAETQEAAIPHYEATYGMGMC